MNLSHWGWGASYRGYFHGGVSDQPVVAAFSVGVNADRQAGPSKTASLRRRSDRRVAVAHATGRWPRAGKRLDSEDVTGGQRRGASPRTLPLGRTEAAQERTAGAVSATGSASQAPPEGASPLDGHIAGHITAQPPAAGSTFAPPSGPELAAYPAGHLRPTRPGPWRRALHSSHRRWAQVGFRGARLPGARA